MSRDDPPDERKQFTLASQSRLSAVEHLAPRFFRVVLDVDYEDCLLTDESDLRDFASIFDDRTAAVAECLDRLEAQYLVDGRAAGSTRIVVLLEYLRASGVIG